MIILLSITIPYIIPLTALTHNHYELVSLYLTKTYMKLYRFLNIFFDILKFKKSFFGPKMVPIY